MKLFWAFGLLVLAADPAYFRGVEQYRAQREAKLKEDDGWLTVIGLFRLKEGRNRIGSAEEIALPSSAPAHLGTIAFSDGKAVYAEEGKPGIELKPNTGIIRTGPPALLHLPRRDQQQDHLRRSALPLRRIRQGRQSDARFQPDHQPSLRVHAGRYFYARRCRGA